MNGIYQWSVGNRMSFNLEKCAQLSMRSTSNESYTFGGRSRKHLNREKDLGVTVSNNLSWIPPLKQEASNVLLHAQAQQTTLFKLSNKAKFVQEHDTAHYYLLVGCLLP